MSQTGDPDDRRGRSLRQVEFVARLIDGDREPPDGLTAEMAELLRASPADREALVEQLLLDSLLRDEFGSVSLSALVDIVADGESSSALAPVGSAEGAPQPTAGTTAVPGRLVRSRAADLADRSRAGRWRTFGWAGAALFGLASIVIGIAAQYAGGAASAAHVIQVAEGVHAEPVERVYLVDIVREADATADFVPPRDARVATQGDRFFVEMNRGDRRWFWGRDAAGATWITVGPTRAIVVNDDELGPSLRWIGDLYTLNLETLLRTFRKHCRLVHQQGSAGTHVIDVTPWPRKSRGGLRHATIEVDRETKAVRRLILERESAEFGRSMVTFTLVDTRVADDAHYGPAGHLRDPATVVTQDTPERTRRDVLVRWFGPMAERWIISAEESHEDR